MMSNFERNECNLPRKNPVKDVVISNDQRRSGSRLKESLEGG